MNSDKEYFPQLQDITKAKINLNDVVLKTPLQKNLNLSEEFQANILLKREDLQAVRSYKIRGAYNKIAHLSKEELKNGVVCASAGNHAQGVAYSCRKLGIKGKIYMPTTTPKQKIRQVEMFGKENVEVVIIGDTYDAADNAAKEDCEKTGMAFIHPFDDPQIIEGQATAGLEILQDSKAQIDYLFIPVGGGGLAAGVGAYFKQMNPQTKIIGVEPAGAPSMKKSVEAGKVIALEKIDKFVDGAAVQKVGEITFEICRKVIDEMVTVPEGRICTKILELYNRDAIVIEPAGALSITALDQYRNKIKGKNVVCIVSGSNNDITRTEEIKERSLLYEGLKHYFIVRFPSTCRGSSYICLMWFSPQLTMLRILNTRKKPIAKKVRLLSVSKFKRKKIILVWFSGWKKTVFVYEYLNEKPDLFQFLI